VIDLRKKYNILNVPTTPMGWLDHMEYFSTIYAKLTEMWVQIHNIEKHCFFNVLFIELVQCC